MHREVDALWLVHLTALGHADAVHKELVPELVRTAGLPIRRVIIEAAEFILRFLFNAHSFHVATGPNLSPWSMSSGTSVLRFLISTHVT